MRVPAEEYQVLKAFFARVGDEVIPVPDYIPAEHHPVAVLERFEAVSMARARTSLALGLGDLIEASQDLPAARVAQIDALLTEQGLPTLTEVRLRFSAQIAGIIRRGRIRSEREYYMLRNVVEAMPDGDREAAWAMLDRFEAEARPRQANGKSEP